MRYLILAVFSVMTFNACGQSIDTAEWTEEVRLSNGSIVQVWRKESRHSHGFPNNPRGGLVSWALAYPPQNARWENDFKVSGRREPISFDLFDGTPYLVIYIADAAFCRSRPPDEYRAQVLRWQGGRWIEVPQAQAPLDRMLMNLAPTPWGRTTQDDYHGLIRLADKTILGPSKHGVPGTVLAYLQNGPQTCGEYLKRHGVGS